MSPLVNLGFKTTLTQEDLPVNPQAVQPDENARQGTFTWDIIANNMASNTYT